MSVLQPGQNLRLITVGPRHLDGDQPLPQADLLGEVNTRECPSPELQHDAEARQFVPWPRQTVARTRPTRPAIARGLPIPAAQARRYVAIHRREIVASNGDVENGSVELETGQQLRALAQPKAARARFARVNATCDKRTI